MQPTLHVFTYKDGLLARLAHDLRLSLTRFEVQLEASRIEARFDGRAFHVDGVVVDGQVRESALSSRDRRQILRHVADDVLRTDDHPALRFEGTVTGPREQPRVAGELTLCGRASAVDLSLDVKEEVLEVRAPLHPSAWGIQPFKALGGAIRLQDRVDVVLRLPRETSGLTWHDWAQASCRWQATPAGAEK